MSLRAVAGGGSGGGTPGGSSGQVQINSSGAFGGVATTGSGNAVLATSPTLVTPALGAATATSINKTAITAPASGSTLAVADGKTATIDNTLTFTGTDASTVACGAGGTVAYLGAVQNFTAQQYFGEATLTDGATINWNLNTQQVATVTLGGNRTMANPTNMQAGATYRLRPVQDGTGSRTLSWGTAYKWLNAGNTPPVLSTAAGAVDFIDFDCDGTYLYGSGSVATTGSGSFVLATSPTLVTPALGTPASGNLSNCTIANATLNPVTVQSVTASSSSLSINLANGQYVILTLSANVTSLSITGWASGVLEKCVLEIRNQGAYNITGWASAKWPAGSAPTVTSGSGKYDLISLSSADNGTTVIGNVIGQNYS
jgi:hypothetical protein